MRIYHLDHGAGFGGAERSLLEMAVSQREIGHDPVVAVGQGGQLADEARAAGLEVSVLGWSPRYVDVPQAGSIRMITAALPGLVRAARLLRRDLDARRPDIVHVHTRKAHIVSALAGRPRGTRVVWHLRDDMPSRSIVRLAARLAIGRADHAVAISSWMVEDYRRIGALPRSRRIGLVPSGIRVTGLRLLQTPWLDGQRDPVVGYIGQIARRKGPDLLIDAATRFEDIADASFLLVGDVAYPKAEQGYGDELRSMITSSPVADRIRWLPATRSPEQAFELVDVLVVPNRVPEPLGRVIVEAMAARRPIVAVASGATPELIDASCATLVPEASEEALAVGIRSVLCDPDGARRRADAAATRADRFDPLTIARQMDEEYRATP